MVHEISQLASQADDCRDAARLEEELQRQGEQVAALQAECAELSRSLRERFEELAILTRLLIERDARIAELERLQAAAGAGTRLKSVLNGCPAWLRARRARTGTERKLIASSGMFDAEWYLKANPDVVATGADPVEHYLGKGAGEGRDPGPMFSTRGYLANNPDVAASKINPLVHYLKFGKAEGRTWVPPSSFTERTQ